jgi:serine/threonine-protein phosphatase PGAM5
MARRTLYLVRHGQYRLHQRDLGSLTHKGEAQSQLTAEALKSLPFSAIYYSPVLRATQTAEIIAAQLGDAKQIEHEALRECIPSIPERYAAYFAGTHPDLTAEEVSDCAEKLDAAFRYYFRPSELEHDVYEMLVCHGNVIRYFVSRVLKLHSDGWSNMMINNCGISRVLVDHDGEMYLISHNDIGHLPEELRTDN